jgi:hypothetical protein
MGKEAMSVDEINVLEKSSIPERKGSDVRVEARDYGKSGSGGFADGSALEGKQGWGGRQFVDRDAVGGKRRRRGRGGTREKLTVMTALTLPIVYVVVYARSVIDLACGGREVEIPASM